jgi:hypothetical protein
VFWSGNGPWSSNAVEWDFRGVRRAASVVVAGTRAIRNRSPASRFGERANPLPEREDLPGSALDAQVMAHYVALAARRFPEYRDAACVCLGGALPTAYVVAPPEFPLLDAQQPVSFDRISPLLAAWLV